MHTREIRPQVNSEERFFAKAGKFANGALAAGAVLVLLMFLRFLYEGLSGRRQFNTPFDLVLYYGLPIGVSAVLLASLRLNTLKKLELLIVCTALTLSMYGAELSFHFGFGSLGTAKPYDDCFLQMQPIKRNMHRNSRKNSATKLTFEVLVKCSTICENPVLMPYQ